MTPLMRFQARFPDLKMIGTDYDNVVSVALQDGHLFSYYKYWRPPHDPYGRATFIPVEEGMEALAQLLKERGL